MFGKQQIQTVCDTACRAAAIRETTLFKLALAGPRT